MAKKNNVVFTMVDKRGELYTRSSIESAVQNICVMIDQIFQEEVDVNHAKELNEVFNE